MEPDPTHYHLSTQLELHSPILDKGGNSAQKQVILLQVQSLNVSDTVCEPLSILSFFNHKFVTGHS